MTIGEYFLLNVKVSKRSLGHEDVTMRELNEREPYFAAAQNGLLTFSLNDKLKKAVSQNQICIYFYYRATIRSHEKIELEHKQDTFINKRLLLKTNSIEGGR